MTANEFKAMNQSMPQNTTVILQSGTDIPMQNLVTQPTAPNFPEINPPSYDQIQRYSVSNG